MRARYWRVWASVAVVVAWATCGRRREEPSAPPDAGTLAPEILVAEEHADRVAFLRPDHLSVLASVATGPSPHVIAVNPKARRAYVAAYGSEDHRRAITVLDLDARAEATHYRLPRCRKPHGLAVDARARLWVTCEEDDALLVVDASSGEVLRREPADGPRTHMVRAAVDGRTIIASHLGAPWLSFFDADRPGVQRRVDLPSGAEGIAVATNGDLWVAHPTQGSVTHLAGGTFDVVATYAVGEQPIHVAAYDDLIAVHVSTDAFVALLDPMSGATKRALRFDTMGGDLLRVAPDRFVVTDAMGQRVLLVDSTRAVLIRQTTLDGGANHLAWSSSLF